MSTERLNVNDVILFKTNRENIGVVKYIGLIHGLKPMAQYVGIELLESIGNLGHSGSVNNYSYFNTKKGYGTHCRLTNVIRKLIPFEIFGLFQRKLIQKNKQIKELELILSNNKTKRSLPCTPILSTNKNIRPNKKLILTNNFSTMTKQSDLTLCDHISPQTPLSTLTLSPKQSNKTMRCKNTPPKTESIVSLFSNRSMSDVELYSFPDIPSPVPSPLITLPTVQKSKTVEVPVEQFRRKKRKHKKHKSKKKKKNKRKKNSISQSDDGNIDYDNYSLEETPIFRDYSHSAPNPYNGHLIKQMNPIKMDQWMNNNVNMVNDDRFMHAQTRGYQQFLADQIAPIGPIVPIVPINQLHPIQNINAYQNQNQFMFMGYQ